MAHKEEEDTAEKEALQIGLDRAIFKNTVTHNFKYNKPVAQKKIHSWKGNRAILVKKQKKACQSQEMYCAEQEGKNTFRPVCLEQRE